MEIWHLLEKHRDVFNVLQKSGKHKTNCIHRIKSKSMGGFH